MASITSKVKIVSDGTPWGTQVFDEEGRDLVQTLRIREITWTIKAAPDGATQLAECHIVCDASIEASAASCESTVQQQQ